LVTLKEAFKHCVKADDPIIAVCLLGKAAAIQVRLSCTLQGYLAHKKRHTRRTLQQPYA